MSLLSTRIFIIHLILSRESRDKKKNQNSIVLKFPHQLAKIFNVNFKKSEKAFFIPMKSNIKIVIYTLFYFLPLIIALSCLKLICEP
jgi:hypothetical protein